MPIKERIVDLAALASLVTACGTGSDATSTSLDDGSTPPWGQSTGHDASSGGRTSGADGGVVTQGAEGNDGAMDSTAGTTTGRPDETTSSTGAASSSDGGDTRGESTTGADDELPPIPDLGGGDEGDDGDDDDDDAAASP